MARTVKVTEGPMATATAAMVGAVVTLMEGATVTQQ